jgi:hypothetical protein
VNSPADEPADPDTDGLLPLPHPRLSDARDDLPALMIAPINATAIHALLDQARSMARDMRADLPAAHAGERCVAPPIGCGQPLKPNLAQHFRDQASRDEWSITGTCQACQDELFKPDEDEIAQMATDPNYERCDVCGEWRYLESVDVGVGVPIRGHDCCADVRFRGAPAPPLCSRVPGCRFGADHFHDCESTVSLLHQEGETNESGN